MGFEPTRAEHNGLAVHRLNHSATLSLYTKVSSKLHTTSIDLKNFSPFHSLYL